MSKIHKINGFVNWASIAEGKNLEFVENGVLMQSEPIAEYRKYGQHFYCITENGNIYTNDQKQVNAFRGEHAAEYMMAEKCCNEGLRPKLISGFDLDSIMAVYAGGGLGPIRPEDVTPGIGICLRATITDMTNGEVEQGTLRIPNVRDFGFDRESNQLIIQSRSSVFSSIDFSREFKEIWQERNVQYEIER